LLDLDPLHQHPNDTTLGLPVQVIQRIGHGGGEVVQVTDDQPQIGLQGGFFGKILLVFQAPPHAL
jgi:hypothetical protein